MGNRGPVDREVLLQNELDGHERSTRGDRLASYGLSIRSYSQMYARQEGRCAICRIFDAKRFLAVDHAHLSGRIRGLLCTRCNVGLGMFQDNPELLRQAAQYLEASENV